MFNVRFEEQAREALNAVKDRRVQGLLIKRAEQLALEPDKQGKASGGGLAGYRSVRAVGQRYRIIYQVQEQAVVVIVVMLGLRKEGDKSDVYAIAGEMSLHGLLAPPNEGQV
jgi:mRNA interferase RelE/StbE